MNIIIIGIGNIGFEVTKLLSELDNIIVIARNYPLYLKEYSLNQNNISFIKGDATNITEMQNISNSQQILDLCGIDALICSVGMNSSSTAIEDHLGFKETFEKNYYSNLIPIQTFFSQLKKKQNSKYILISASSGHHADKRLTGYPISKWALENTFSALREETNQYGISVDVIVVPTLKNRYSKVWKQDKGIDPKYIAKKIISSLVKPNNSRIFVPRRYIFFRFVERLFPIILDRYHGLSSFRKRRKKYKMLSRQTILITGAAQGLGKELALTYSLEASELYLLDRDLEKLQELKNEISKLSNAKVIIFQIDLKSEANIIDVLKKIEHVDILINNVGIGFFHPILTTKIDVFKDCFSINLFASTFLTSLLFQRDILPNKVINILSTTAIKGRLKVGLYSSAKGAFWNFTRSLRRIFGNSIQIVEVIPSFMTGTNYYQNSNHFNENSNPIINKKKKKFSKITFLKVTTWSAKEVAARIYRLEKSGKEIIMIPPIKSKLFLILETISSSLFSKIF